MTFDRPPAVAAWQHRDARDGFEVVFLHCDGEGCRVDGATTAVGDDEAWVVRYGIDLARDWTTRSARAACRSTAGEHEVTVKTDGSGRWQINGAATPVLDGCLDVDLESSAMTNAFPVHRLQLEVGEHAEAPAAYVRAVDLAVERLEQRYVRLDDDDDDGGRQRYQYSAPRFGFECELVYDEHGLVLDYPGIAVRAG
jgi:hypothetical protein